MGLVDRIDERPGGVDDDLCGAREGGACVDVAQVDVPASALSSGALERHVVGACGPGVQRRADEPEDEPGVVVHDVGVGVLDAA